MTETKVMILEGPSGLSFFLQEAILSHGLADHVHRVSWANQAIDLISASGAYHLVVINLSEAWDQGMELGFWLSQQAVPCPIILIMPAEMPQPTFSEASFIMVLASPLSLHDFTRSVHTVLSRARQLPHEPCLAG